MKARCVEEIDDQIPLDLQLKARRWCVRRGLIRYHCVPYDLQRSDHGPGSMVVEQVGVGTRWEDVGDARARSVLQLKPARWFPSSSTARRRYTNFFHMLVEPISDTRILPSFRPPSRDLTRIFQIICSSSCCLHFKVPTSLPVPAILHALSPPAKPGRPRPWFTRGLEPRWFYWYRPTKGAIHPGENRNAFNAGS